MSNHAWKPTAVLLSFLLAFQAPAYAAIVAQPGMTIQDPIPLDSALIIIRPTPTPSPGEGLIILLPTPTPSPGRGLIIHAL